MTEINVPFEGFYKSFYSEEIDHEEEQFIECVLDNGEINKEQADKLADLFWRHTDYSKAYDLIARAYIIAFNAKFKEWADVDLNLQFTLMTSPREYNFETDRLFAKADDAALLALRAKVDEAELRRIIRERFTSYDGFISYYSNNLEDWESESDGVLEWDQNQLCTLIMCFLPKDWRWDVYYATCDEDGYSAWEGAVNWQPINEFIEQCKADTHE